MKRKIVRSHSRRLGPVWKLVDEAGDVWGVMSQADNTGQQFTKLEALAALEVYAEWVEDNKWKGGSNDADEPAGTV